MEQTPHAPSTSHQDATRSGHAVPEALVREELERVLASREFQASKLCQNFLRYTVEKTLAGQTAQLKERTIGMEVFGKPTSYDPSEDAGVRVRAGEVRKRLRAYYVDPPVDAKIVIELRHGTYVPEFSTLAPEEERAPAISGAPNWRLPLLFAAVVLLLSAVAFYWLRPHPVAEPLRAFWTPVFQSHKPVLVCVAPVPVYSTMRNTSSSDRPNKAEDFVLVPGQFASIGDVNASLRIIDLLGRMREPSKLYVGKEVSFADLRTGPAVLVGFTYTQWHEIGAHFRYSIDLARRPFGILQDGAPTDWAIKMHPDDPNLPEDYAIVSRFFYPGTNDMVVQITGISHYGTEAAADLVTNPVILEQVLRKLPAGWQQRNLQIVIHMDVISGFPSVPTVVATYVW
ncbi:MAG: hypothetical protein ABSG62_16050 [Terracidiphilus sp.]|jgi:hypothetical protein